MNGSHGVAMSGILVDHVDHAMDDDDDDHLDIKSAISTFSYISHFNYTRSSSILCSFRVHILKMKMQSNQYVPLFVLPPSCIHVFQQNCWRINSIHKRTHFLHLSRLFLFITLCALNCALEVPLSNENVDYTDREHIYPSTRLTRDRADFLCTTSECTTQ